MFTFDYNGHKIPVTQQIEWRVYEYLKHEGLPQTVLERIDPLGKISLDFLESVYCGIANAIEEYGEEIGDDDFADLFYDDDDLTLREGIFAHLTKILVEA